mgnify:CR=1 FL=1
MPMLESPLPSVSAPVPAVAWQGLRNVSWLESLSDERLSVLAGQCLWHRLESGQVLHGAYTDERMYMLINGQLSVGSYSNVPLRLQADHLTVVGERQRLQLDDGSKVLLNTNSAFSSSLKGQQRIARLYQGEAFFDIAPTHGLPLEIDAGPVRASVRDTAFAVRYLNGEAQVQVQRGDVDLSNTFDDARVRLSAGESIRIGPNGFDRPAKLDAATELAWVQGRLVFENCPLSQVLAELRRYYPGWIINNNERLANVAVTGNYRLDQPLDAVRSLAHITSAKLQEFPALVILN